LRRALPTIATMRSVCAAQLRRRLDDRQLQLDQADHDAVRRFVQASETAHLDHSTWKGTSFIESMR
jgi:hypothetical protein